MQRHILLLLLLSAVPQSATAAAPSRFHSFAHIGDGGGLRTIFLLVNQGSRAVSVTLDFFGDDGAPQALSFEGTTASSVTTDVPAGGMRRLASAGAAAEPRTGWARVRASGEVGVMALFQVSGAGQVTAEAAVESQGPLILFDIFVDQGPGAGTGVALASLAESGTLAVRLALRDGEGRLRASREILLPPRGRTARFVAEIFPEVGAFRGTLRVQTSGPVAAVALQQTGVVLTSLPVVDVVF